MNRVSVALFLLLALIWGASFTFIKVSLDGLTPSQLVLIRLVLGAGWPAPSFTWPVIVSIVLLGVVGTGAGYVIYFRLINDLGATTASTVNYLVPVTAVLIGTVTLQESITPEMVLGTIIVLLGLAVAERRVDLSRLRRRLIPVVPARPS